MTLTTKKLFLIDCLGALISAFLLGIVLVKYKLQIRMPVDVLYLLAAIAGVFAIYSSICYFTFKQNGKPFLIAIAIANLLYCFLTIGLVIYFFAELTTLGMIYFIGELIVILTLVYFEVKYSFYN